MQALTSSITLAAWAVRPMLPQSELEQSIQSNSRIYDPHMDRPARFSRPPVAKNQEFNQTIKAWRPAMSPARL